MTNSFNENDFIYWERDSLAFVKSIILKEEKMTILNVDRYTYIKKMYEENKLEKLNVSREGEHIHPPIKTNERYGDSYTFTIDYPFSGSHILFSLRPSLWTVVSADIVVKDIYNTVSFQFRVTSRDPDEFKKVKDEMFNKAFCNIENINNEVEPFNQRLLSHIETVFDKYKKDLEEENLFFKAIKVPVDPNTKEIYTPPVLTKKIIPQIAVPSKKVYSLDPSMSEEMYKDILKVIYVLCKSIEKKPTIYEDKDEESLRDYILPFLETRYTGTTATGETFNKKGKTDILLKYQDGTNLFVAECKWWSGAKNFHQTINQLFDGYLTWRDSKTAIIFFVNNKEITNVIDTIILESPKHPYYLSSESTSDSSFSYIFHFPSDKSRKIYLEIMVFHYPPTK